VEEESVSIEDHLIDALFLRDLRDRFADLLGCVDIPLLARPDE
jgi:hypothetical protein